jgi:hypothetical protein
MMATRSPLRINSDSEQADNANITNPANSDLPNADDTGRSKDRPFINIPLAVMTTPLA